MVLQLEKMYYPHVPVWVQFAYKGIQIENIYDDVVSTSWGKIYMMGPFQNQTFEIELSKRIR